MTRSACSVGVVSGVVLEGVVDEAMSEVERLEPRKFALLIDYPRGLGTSRSHDVNDSSFILICDYQEFE